MGQKLARWLFFGVALALVPVAFDVLHFVTRGGHLNRELLTENGELLLISAAIAGAAVGELVASGSRLALGKIISGGGAVVVLGLASLYFVDVASAARNHEKVVPGVVCDASLYLFGSSLVASAACVALSEVK